VVPRNVDPVSVDRVLQVARAEGLTGELQVAAPTAPDRPFTVAETSPGLPIRKGSIAIDPYTAQVTERIGWDDYPFLAQVREVGMQAHTGTLLGIANQIVLALLVIVTIALILIGYRMWWKRSPYGEGRMSAVPPPAMRQLTAPVGVPVVLVTVVLAWLMPAFGVSLAAFIVLDLVAGAVRQRQERLRRAVTAGALLVAGCVLGVAVLVNTPAPVTRVDAVRTFPGQRAPEVGEEAPLDPPPLAAEALPGGTAGTGVVAATPRPRPGVRTEAPAGPAPAPPESSAGADDPDDPPAGDGDAGSGRAGSGGGSDDSRGTDTPGPSETRGERADVAEPEQPSVEEEPADDEPPGLVANLSEATKPITSYLVDTVDSVTGGLLGG
jgi:hypothetical protein